MSLKGTFDSFDDGFGSLMPNSPRYRSSVSRDVSCG
jgi:hypothetical protein